MDNAHPGGLEPFFVNEKLGRSSFDPPTGFTAEEIWEFDGAKENFESVQEIQELIDDSKVESYDVPLSELLRKWKW